MAEDFYAKSQRGTYGEIAVNAPIENGYSITPADSDLSTVTRALYIGTFGNVTVITAGGDTITFVSVPAGSILPVRCTQVKASTTATNILGLY